MLAQTPNPRPSPPLPALPLSDVSLGPVVMADDPCEAAFGSAHPTGPRKYYRARYYDPKIGRFIREDPIRQQNGNLYPYVNNNPTGYIDPRGDEPISAVLGGGLLLGGTAPAWVPAAAVVITGAAMIKMSWDIGEYAADRLFPPPGLPPTTVMPPMPPVPPFPLNPPAPPPVCEAKKPGCQCVCFRPGMMGPPMGRVSSSAACSAICTSNGWSGSSCR